VGGCGKARVAFSAAAPTRHQETLTGLGEIEEPLAGSFVVDYGTHRHIEIDGVALGAGLVAAFAVTSALGLVLGIMAVLQEGVLVRVGDQYDVASVAAIAPARAAPRDILLPAKGKAAVPPVAGLYRNS
jgi:hypothetical protein